MLVKEMVGKLRFPCRITVRNEENFDICEMDSNSSAMRFFADMEVLEWFPFALPGPSRTAAAICIFIKDDRAEETDVEVESCSEE